MKNNLNKVQKTLKNDIEKNITNNKNVRSETKILFDFVNENKNVFVRFNKTKSDKIYFLSTKNLFKVLKELNYLTYLNEWYFIEWLFKKGFIFI